MNSKEISETILLALQTGTQQGQQLPRGEEEEKECCAFLSLRSGKQASEAMEVSKQLL